MRGINAELRAKAFRQEKNHSGLMTPKIRSMTFTEDVNEYIEFTYWGFFRGVRQVRWTLETSRKLFMSYPITLSFFYMAIEKNVKVL